MIKKIIHGSFYAFAGMIIGQTINFFIKVIIVRNLKPDEFGSLILVFSIITLIGGILTLGFSDGIARYTSYYKSKNDIEKLKGILISSVKLLIPIGISATILIFLFPQIITHIFKINNILIIVQIFSIMIPFIIILNIILSILRGEKAILEWTLSNDVLPSILKISLLILCSIIGYNLFKVSVIYVIVPIIMSFISYFLLMKKEPMFFRGQIYSNETKNLFQYSWPLFISSVVYQLERRVDIFIIGIFLSTTKIGIYSIALTAAEMILYFLYAVNKIFMPVITTLKTENKIDEIKYIYKIVTNWLIYITFPIVLMMFLFSSSIISYIFGPVYKQSSIYFNIMIIGFFVNVFVGSEDQMQLAFGITKPRLFISLINLTSAVILNYILINKLGILGAAIATSLTWIVTSGISVYILYHYTHIHPFTLRSIYSMAIDIILFIFIYWTIKPYTTSISFFFILLICFLFFICSCIIKLLTIEKRVFKNQVLPLFILSK